MDDLLNAVKTCFRKYVDFSGRAARPEFWWFFLFQVIALVLARIIGGGVLYGIVALALLLPGLAVGARRLHDIDKSGWFLLLGLIPLIGALVLLYFCVQPSGPANQYGGVETSPDAPTVMPGPGPQ